MKKLTILTALIACFAFSGLKAQSQKVAFVNIKKIADTLPEMDTINAKVQAKIDEIKNELLYWETEMKKEEEALGKSPESIRAYKEKQLQDMYQNYQELRASAEGKLQQFQAEAQEPMLAKIKVAIGDVSKLKGYTHVMDAQMLIYTAGGDDITDAVIKHMLTKKAVQPKPGTPK